MIQRLIDLRSRICRWIVGWSGGWYPAYWEYAALFLWGSVLLVGENTWRRLGWLCWNSGIRTRNFNWVSLPTIYLEMLYLLIILICNLIISLGNFVVFGDLYTIL